MCSVESICVAMFSKLLVWSSQGLARTITASACIPSVFVQQRSFGVFSAIKDNLNEKVEQKKQREIGSSMGGR